MRSLLFTLAFTLILPLAAHAAFDSGSDDSDGALTFAQDLGVVDFDPAALSIDLDGDNVFHFTTITIASGTTVRLRGSILGEGKPVIWLASGAVSIEGDIDLDGAAGQDYQAAVHVSAEPGAGGFSGGVGSDGVTIEPQSGNGPGGGGAMSGTDGDGAGFLTNGAGPQGGTSYGNKFLLPLIGGSGGSGAGRVSPSVAGAGGGAGGGALLLASSTSIAINGEITARGGAGGTTIAAVGRRAGGGSGGAIRVISDSVTGTGTINVNRGLGSTNQTSFQGSVGRIRIEALTPEFLSTGTVTANSATYGSPGPVFPPANAPTVKVTSVDSVNAPANPTASFENPDITINADGTVTIAIEATNIPVGTVVNLTLRSEAGTTIQVDSTPLAGTTALSTATAGPVTIPNGFTRITVLTSF